MSKLGIIISAVLLAGSTSRYGECAHRIGKALEKTEIAGHKVLRLYTVGNSGLVDPSVKALFQDDSGRIWAGTERGLSVFDEAPNRWTSFTTRTGEVLENRITMIGQSNDHKLWFAAEPRGPLGPGVSSFDGAYWSQVDVTRKSLTISSRYLFADSVQAIFKGSQGKLWFAVEDGLISYDGTDWKRYSGMSDLIHEDRPFRVYSAVEDSDGAVWLGGNGIIRFDERSNTCKVYDPMRSVVESTEYRNDIIRRMRARMITCTYEDRQRGLWFGSSDGRLYSYTRKSDSWSNYDLLNVFRQAGDGTFFDSGSYPASKDTITLRANAASIYQDNLGQILIGTRQGLLVFVESERKWKVLTTKNSCLIANMVNTIIADNQSRIWLGTSEGIMVLQQ